MRALVFFIFLFAFTLLGLGGIGFVLNQEAPPQYKLEALLNEDVLRLKQAQKLPQAFDTLSRVELHGGTQEAKEWLKEIRLPFHTTTPGTHTLEVLLVTWSEGPKDGAMIQYNLVDNASGNMVWELGRTFILKDKDSSYFRARHQLMNWLRH